MTSNHIAAKPQFDVAIVGGGPAGSAAALICVRHGLKVVVMEAVSFPRDRPGETLHPGIEVLWEQLGVAEAVKQARFPRSDGYYLDWGSVATFVPYGADERGTWLGFHAWRAELDQILANAAREQGAAWWEKWQARQPVVVGDRIVGVRADQGPVFSHFVLDASGAAQWLPKHMGLTIYKYSERLVVRYGYRFCTAQASIRPSFLMRRDSWAWVAEVKPGLAAWATLTPSQASCENLLGPFFNDTKSAARQRGADATWRVVSESAGPGYFVLGDSAASLDPACSHGVLRAVSSGILAAQQVIGIVRGVIPESQGVMLYRNWLTGWFRRDAESLSRQYLLYSPELAERVRPSSANIRFRPLP